MYADRYGQRHGLKPGSVMLALGMTALPILGLVLSAEVRKIIKIDTPFIAEPIDAPKPPPPPDVKPKPQPKVQTPPVDQVFTPPTKIDLPPVDTIKGIDVIPPPPTLTPPGTGTEIGTVIEKKVPPPVFIEAGIDSRYANLFQPPYPSSEIRAGNEGRVVVRVLIGIDGRVKQVEKVSATSDAFFAAAERQALTKWRFKPATKDGVPFEQWKQMSLRFQLNGND
jgi:periplasmic protein TonB